MSKLCEGNDCTPLEKSEVQINPEEDPPPFQPSYNINNSGPQFQGYSNNGYNYNNHPGGFTPANNQPMGYNANPTQPMGYHVYPNPPIGYNANLNQPMGYDLNPYQPIGYNVNPNQYSYGNNGSAAGYVGSNFDLEITLSCFVFWFFNFIFGAIAFILAILGLHRNRPGNEANTGCMKRASLIVSIVGLILAVFIWLVILTI